MPRFVSGRTFAVLVAAPIFLSMLVLYLKKKKRSAEKESTSKESAPLSGSPIHTGEDSDHYDVFLSFRGPDTRKGFTDHLYHRLINTGIRTIAVFRDNSSIPIGKEFGPQLLDAITHSKILIPIISENYGASGWCLRELIHIMNQRKSMSQIVLPIFYKVSPSEVRNLQGDFGKAFHLRRGDFDKTIVAQAQQALMEVTHLSGWESEKIANGHEGYLVNLVVETVLKELHQDFQLHVPKQLVNPHGRVEQIMSWIDTPSLDARMLGIYGMGGIGKTTLAKCIFNQLLNKFMHISFLPDIQETVRCHGIQYLQNQLIYDILQIKNQVCKVDYGISFIKSRFKGKKVLILLDDIDHKDQLDALVGERNWFTPGSIIIVTTRNEAVLDQSEFVVDYKYKLNEMSMAHSLLLFNRHAFRMDQSWWDFRDISCDIVSTVGGLPLALEVIGSYLYGKANKKVWQDMLKKLRKGPQRDVLKILKISYDALEHEHQKMFLDIACFFIGKKSKFVMYLWEECGFHASQGIEELKQRSLIKIEDDGELKIHDQLRDLGRYISCHRRPPERCPRLWVYKEAFRVLMEKKGTDKIKGICLDEPRGSPQTFTNEHFQNLRSLVLLQLRRTTLIGDFNGLFCELRWLQWLGIENDESFLSTNLHLPKLLVLQLSYNWITDDWGGWTSIMAAKRLKVLDLEWCINLRCTPDLWTFTELEILILKDCFKLEKVHRSIGRVKSLVSLNLAGCGSLMELPKEVGNLEVLKELILDYSGITKIPTSIGSLRKLEKLSARACRSLRKIPDSIGDLENLLHLDFSCSGIEKVPSAIGRLTSLRRLSLKNCRNLKGEIPREIRDLSSLENLDINDTPISDLPEGIQNLSVCKRLSLWGCCDFRSVP